jgi:hypothetical protein
VAGHKAIIAQLDRSVDPDNNAFPHLGHEIIDDEMERLYSETWQEYFYCHPSHILKHHTNCDAVFSFGANENVVVEACDYFKEEVMINLRPTAARMYRKESLVRQYILTFLSTDVQADKSRPSEFPTISTLAQ